MTDPDRVKDILVCVMVTLCVIALIYIVVAYICIYGGVQN